jgi:hypothetical protein
MERKETEKWKEQDPHQDNAEEGVAKEKNRKERIWDENKVDNGRAGRECRVATINEASIFGKGRGFPTRRPATFQRELRGHPDGEMTAWFK